MHPLLRPSQLAMAASRASANGTAAVAYTVRTSLAQGVAWEATGADDRTEVHDSGILRVADVEDPDDLANSLMHREELLFFSCGDIEFQVTTRGADDVRWEDEEDEDGGDDPPRRTAVRQSGRRPNRSTIVEGREVLNPGFLYETSHELEVMIEFGTPPWRPTTTDAEVAMLLARDLSSLAAANGRAPVVSMHLPAAPYRDTPKNDRSAGRLETVRNTHALCLRMTVAFSTNQTPERLTFLEGIGRLASEWGIGLHVGDHRPGRVRGEWINVRSFNLSEYRNRLVDLGIPESDDVVTRALPVTVVGPARIGSSKAILGALAQHSVGLVGLSVSAMQELAFINLVLEANSVRDADGAESYRSVRHGLEAVVALLSRTSDESLARHVLDLSEGGQCEPAPTSGGAKAEPVNDAIISPEQPAPDFSQIDLNLAADYSVLVGDLYPLRVDAEAVGRPLWLVWDVPFGVVDMTYLFRALDDVLGRHSDAHVVQYARARLGGTGRVRGRAKVSVQLARKRYRQHGIRPYLRSLSERTEHHVRATVADKAGLAEAEVRLRVMWRERWLGAWDAPL